MKPKAVVFDLGKVLLDFDYSIVARRISARGNRRAEDVARFLMETPALCQYEAGLLTRAAFHKGLCEATGYCGSLDEFASEFGNIFTPIEPMIRLNAEIRERGTPTYIFSNTNDLAIEYIRTAYPFFGDFHDYILSYEHGAMKPDPLIYEVVERVTARSGRELFYLDDRPENTAMADSRDWQTVTHVSPSNSRERARSAGLLE